MERSGIISSKTAKYVYIYSWLRRPFVAGRDPQGCSMAWGATRQAMVILYGQRVRGQSSNAVVTSLAAEHSVDWIDFLGLPLPLPGQCFNLKVLAHLQHRLPYCLDTPRHAARVSFSSRGRHKCVHVDHHRSGNRRSPVRTLQFANTPSLIIRCIRIIGP